MTKDDFQYEVATFVDHQSETPSDRHFLMILIQVAPLEQGNVEHRMHTHVLK